MGPFMLRAIGSVRLELENIHTTIIYALQFGDK